MMDKKDITGIILCGGKSRRMGTDKGFLRLNGKLFTQHSIDALQTLVSETILVSNQTKYDIFGLKRVEDEIENAGPLAGLYSGLHHSKSDYNFVLSCDVPLIKSEILEELLKAMTPNLDLVQVESKGRNMPLIALYHKRCKDVFLKLLEQGEYRVQYAVSQCKAKNVLLNEQQQKFVQNMNTPEQINEISR